MDLSHFFDHHKQKINKTYFIHLICVAKADGHLDEKEVEVLHRIGRRFGFTDAEIDVMFNAQKTEPYIPAYELRERFDEVYDVILMILADDIVEESELKVAKKFAVASGFTDSEIEILIPLLIDGVQQDQDDDILFKNFIKRKKTL